MDTMHRVVPPGLASRVNPGELLLWPLMGMLWGFDVDKVAERSPISGWIRDRESVFECIAALHRGRAALGSALRGVEDLPRHEEMRKQ